MAIDNIPFADTDKLAWPEKSFFPLKIPVSHWQLRHYISHPEKDILYYASGQDIYYLNTATRKRKHITTLPFEARCTASGFGYICVGGEDEGHFAIIKLEGRNTDVDAPLPLDYWATHRNTPRAASIKVERVGEDIVNSISIHQIQDEGAHLYDVVAVLTNNDKTVRVYSLSQGIETAVLDFPFPVNHATISPDGTMLVAVGDLNRAYFFTRVLHCDPPQIPKPHNRLTMCAVGWELISDAGLYVPQATAFAGYFTTAWSPSGHLVALGSEAGYITVFDVGLLGQIGSGDAEDAIVATLPSSRPNMEVHMHPGAVRSMLFAPDPWDLLIWAEDQGRVCIGDLRTGLKTKQTVDLDPRQDGLTRLELEDVAADEDPAEHRRMQDMEEDFLRRHRNAPENASAVNFAAEYIESRRRSRRQRLEEPSGAQAPYLGVRDRMSIEDDPHGLTVHEQQILESLRTTRQREEARSQGGTPRSVNYTMRTMFQARTNDRPTFAGRDRHEFLADADPDTFPELSRASQLPGHEARRDRDLDDALPPLHAIQDYLMLRDRATRRVGSETQQTQSPAAPERFQPRRRASVVLSPPTYSEPNSSAVPPHATRATLPSTSTPPPMEDDSSPWQTIANAMDIARGPLFDTASVARTSDHDRDRERLRMVARQRDRLRGLQRSLEATASIGETNAATRPTGIALPSRYEVFRDATSAARGFQDSYDVLLRRRTGTIGVGVGTGREIGVRTAGLAISRDGSTVWAATEEGVFGIKVQLKSRMYRPAVDLR